MIGENDSDWRGELLKDDKRWKFGTPPASNANFAWVQHFIHHLAPTGLAGFVLVNGSMSSNQSGEGEIRKNISRNSRPSRDVERIVRDCVPGARLSTARSARAELHERRRLG